MSTIAHDMSVIHNPRVIRPTGPNRRRGDEPPLSDEFLRFVVHLENVREDDSDGLPHDVLWKPIGPAASGAGQAALCEMSLADAKRLAETPPENVSRPVLAAAETIVRFTRDSFVLRARGHTLQVGPRSLIMGIINVTSLSTFFSLTWRYLPLLIII